MHQTDSKNANRDQKRRMVGDSIANIPEKIDRVSWYLQTNRPFKNIMTLIHSTTFSVYDLCCVKVHPMQRTKYSQNVPPKPTRAPYDACMTE